MIWTPDLLGLAKDVGRVAGFRERMKMEMPRHNGFVGIQKAENGYIVFYMNREFVFANFESAVRKMREIFEETKGEEK